MSAIKLIFCCYFFSLDLGLWADSRLQPFLDSQFPGVEIHPIPLKGGFSQSKNYRFSERGYTYVLRLQAERTTERRMRRELIALRQGAEAGLAPRVHWASEKGDAILMDWVEGELLDVSRAKNHIPTLAKAIQKIHSLPRNPISRSCTETDRVLDMISFAEEGHIVPQDRIFLLEEGKRLVSDLMRKEYPSANLHGDLNPRNIFLTQEGVQFIDWSESNWDDPYFDLTCFTLMLGYTEEEERL